MLPGIPWLLILSILQSDFRGGESAAPMVSPSNMALLSKSSGNGGNSFLSIGVWLTLTGIFSEGSSFQHLLS
jgi:hypothetical protein